MEKPEIWSIRTFDRRRRKTGYGHYHAQKAIAGKGRLNLILANAGQPTALKGYMDAGIEGRVVFLLDGVKLPLQGNRRGSRVPNRVGK